MGKENNDLLSNKIIEKQFKELTGEKIKEDFDEGKIYYAKSEIDSFLSSVSLEIKGIEDYATYIHRKNEQLQSEISSLRDKIKVNEEAASSSAAAKTIDKIVSYAEAEASRMKEEAKKMSSDIISQGKRQASGLVRKATEESKNIKEKAKKHLDTIEEYRKEMIRYLEEYNQDIRVRSRNLKQMAKDLEDFADRVESNAVMEANSKFNKKIV